MWHPRRAACSPATCCSWGGASVRLLATRDPAGVGKRHGGLGRPCRLNEQDKDMQEEAGRTRAPSGVRETFRSRAVGIEVQGLATGDGVGEDKSRLCLCVRACV